jgi:hypothetical protein
MGKPPKENSGYRRQEEQAKSPVGSQHGQRYPLTSGIQNPENEQGGEHSLERGTGLAPRAFPYPSRNPGHAS